MRAQLLCCVRLFVTPWTVAHQSLLSMKFPRQEYWSGLPFLGANFYQGFPCSSVGKESAYSAGDPGSIPGSGRSPGEGNDNPLQYPCL